MKDTPKRLEEPKQNLDILERIVRQNEMIVSLLARPMYHLESSGDDFPKLPDLETHT